MGEIGVLLCLFINFALLVYLSTSHCFIIRDEVLFWRSITHKT